MQDGRGGGRGGGAGLGCCYCAVNSTDCFCQILGVRAFQHVSSRPLCKSPFYLGVRLEGGEDDDPCSGKLSTNRNHGVDAAHIWKTKVHESDIGLVFTKTFDHLVSVRRLRNHQHARLAIDDHRDGFANESMIVNTENPNGGVHNRLLELPSKDKSMVPPSCSKLK